MLTQTKNKTKKVKNHEQKQLSSTVDPINLVTSALILRYFKKEHHYYKIRCIPITIVANFSKLVILCGETSKLV